MRQRLQAHIVASFDVFLSFALVNKKLLNLNFNMTQACVTQDHKESENMNKGG